MWNRIFPTIMSDLRPILVNTCTENHSLFDKSNSFPTLVTPAETKLDICVRHGTVLTKPRIIKKSS